MRRKRTVLEIAQAGIVRTEKQEVAVGDRMMHNLGFKSVHFSQPRASMQTRGIPDRKYYHEGYGITFWWEAKTKGGKQSADQAAFAQMATACGEKYVLGTSDALAESVKAILARTW